MSKRFLDDDTDELDLWASTKPVNARWLREEAPRRPNAARTRDEQAARPQGQRRQRRANLQLD